MELDPDVELKLVLKLYTDVKNVNVLKNRLLNGELQCCFIKPSLICDPFQVVVAANKACVSEKLTTKSIYTEILFNLSPTKSISRSLQTFGIDDNDDNLLVLVLCKETTENEIFKCIEGVEVSLDKLDEYSNLDLIKRTYKINDTECCASSILDSIVSRIATKDFLSS